jgi:hypothetical protein
VFETAAHGIIGNDRRRSDTMAKGCAFLASRLEFKPQKIIIRKFKKKDMPVMSMQKSEEAL